MQQGINLYQACFYPDKKNSELLYMLILLIAVVLLLAVNGFFGYRELVAAGGERQGLESKYYELELLAKKHREQLISLKSLSDTLSSADNIHQELIKKHQQAEGIALDTVKYSQFFEYLAKIIPAHVWLDSIKVSNKESTLKGWAVDKHAFNQFTVSLDAYLQDNHKAIAKIDIQYKDESKKYYFIIGF